MEKLLRSCTGVDALFILMRTKKGFTVEQRTDNLFKDGVSMIINIFLVN